MIFFNCSLFEVAESKSWIDLLDLLQGCFLKDCEKAAKVSTASFLMSFPLRPCRPPSVCVCSWLVYSDPGFGGFVGVLEEGEYPCPESWGFPQPFVGSLRPLQMVAGFQCRDLCASFEMLPSNTCLSIAGTFEGGASL